MYRERSDIYSISDIVKFLQDIGIAMTRQTLNKYEKKGWFTIRRNVNNNRVVNDREMGIIVRIIWKDWMGSKKFPMKMRYDFKERQSEYMRLSTND